MKRTIIVEKNDCSITLIEEDGKKDLYEVRFIDKVKLYKNYLRARYYYDEYLKIKNNN